MATTQQNVEHKLSKDNVNPDASLGGKPLDMSLTS